MLGSPLLDAAAALAAAALYYLLPMLTAALTRSQPSSPPRPEPFSLPVALPLPLSPPQPSGRPERPDVSERLEALHTLWTYYVSIGMPQGEIEEILRPHLLHLVR